VLRRSRCPVTPRPRNRHARHGHADASPGNPDAHAAPDARARRVAAPAAQDALRAYLAGRGLTLAGACLAITADPGETAHCYLVLEGSTLERMRLVVGRWASGRAVVVTLECGPAGTCRITEVAGPAGSP